MEFVSSMNAELVATMDKVHEIKKAIRGEKKAFIQAKIELGWKKFVMFSHYYGSHEELGEGDRKVKYLFAPHVDITHWVRRRNGFGHGHFSKNATNKRFEKWLATLADSDYIIL